MTTPYRPFLVPPAARWFRWAVAVVWLATGLLVLHPGYRAIGLDHLHRYGLPSWLMTATCIGEIALGAWVVFSRARTGITFLQVGMVASFTAIIAINEPMLLVNPYGAMTKNIPLVILLLVAWRLERGGWTPPTEWILRSGMAVIWITEGVLPKILFPQAAELELVAASGIVPMEPVTFLAILGAAEAVSGVAVLLARGRLLSLLLAGQLSALLILPVLVGVIDPGLWIHPFQPLTKDVPILVGTAVVFLRKTPFLTTRWSNLFLLTYRIPAEKVEKLVPPGVTLEKDATVSFLSLDFRGTRVLGIPVPGFRNFLDINLRTYVQWGSTKGVVFVREIVPSRTVAWVARTVFGEPFRAAPIRSEISESDGKIIIHREFDFGGRTHTIRAEAKASPSLPDTHPFLDRTWGFGRAGRGETISYEIVRSRMETCPVESWSLDMDWAAVYGKEWAFLQDAEPVSVDMAVGTEIKVRYRS